MCGEGEQDAKIPQDQASEKLPDKTLEQARERGANFVPKQIKAAKLPVDPIIETMSSPWAEEMGLRTW